MRISRVYIDAELVGGQVIALDKAQSHYLKKVLRLKHGAAFFLFNGRAAVDFEARLLVDGKRLAAEIGAAQVLTTEAGLSSEVIQGLGRLDRVDWMIQKTTELGASRLSIFNAEHSQSPLKPAQLEKNSCTGKAWRSAPASNAVAQSSLKSGSTTVSSRPWKHRPTASNCCSILTANRWRRHYGPRHPRYRFCSGQKGD